jgi:hypothetical protein
MRPRPRCARRSSRTTGSDRHAKRAFAAVATLDDRADDVGNDVAGALDEHPVADANVLALDLVHVVQRALVIVTPPTATGSSSAIGVIVPSRPTDATTFLMRVVPWRGLNL